MAGVSVSTVSRVLNEPEKVKPDTLAQVQQVVKKLGYHPSRVARRLRLENGQAHLIGLIITDVQNPFFADVVRGVEDVAYENGYALLLSNSDENLGKQRFCLETLRSESVDGIIIPPVEENEGELEWLRESGIPLVFVDRRLQRTRFDTVTSDNEQGAYEATELLIALGHRRIGFVGGIPNISTTKDRQQGYRRALNEHRIPFDASLVRLGDSRQDSGNRLAGELLDQPEPPTALFTGNNLITLGALSAIHARGLRIPQDVAIVGYDDVPWALALNPPLTAVSQPGYEMGRRAAELLLSRIHDPGRSPTLLTLQPQLVIRRSCGSAPQANT